MKWRALGGDMVSTKGVAVGMVSIMTRWVSIVVDDGRTLPLAAAESSHG